MADLSVPTFCIVTGASKGIGRAIATQLAQKAAPKSSFYLIARNEKVLNETAQNIREKVAKDTEIRCISADLSTEDGVEKANQEIFGNIGHVSRYSHAILVHNTASVGDMTKYSRELDDMSSLQDFCRLNITGPIVLTSRFFKAFGHGKDSRRKTIIQITSDNATTPFKTMHMYCMAKAGRDMFFRVMALEEPEVRVISYDPGAVDTDMYKETFTSTDDELRSTVKNIAKETYFLKPEQSAGALVKALEDDTYESAAVVRAYDILGMNVDF